MTTVKIYTTPTCVFCKMAKDWFKANNVSYQEVDVSKDRHQAEEMIRKSGQMGVPVIEVDGKIVVGFNKAKLQQMLR